MRHVAVVFFALSMTIVALTGIFRPDVIVGWAKNAHPRLTDDDKSVLWITRFIGVGGLLATAFFWVIVIRSLGR